MKVNNVVPSKFHQELVDAGVKCNIFHNLEDGRYFVGECEIKLAEGTDMELVQQIIDAHIPIVLEEETSEIEELKQALAELTILISMGGM